jgi:hypothetical protein
MAESGRYMYAIARGADLDALGETRGLKGEPLDAIERNGLVAVVSTVDLDEFGEEGLRRNLEDLQWLEEVARGHDAVIQAVAALGPTAPLRLATICLDDAGVRARLDEWHHALVQALDRVEGRYEWSVKAFSRQEPAQDTEAEAGSSASTGKGAGLAYLQRKRDLTQRQMQAEERAAETAEAVHAALAQRSVASRRLPSQDPRLTGHTGQMTLNGAYLVPAEDGEAFAAAAQALSQEHPDAHLEVGGPWPPYSFATLEQR